MASLADSKAHFKARALEYGIPDGLITNLQDAGFETMGQLAVQARRRMMQNSQRGCKPSTKV